MKKTISLDLWNTLIKSNPDFIKYRNRMIKKYTSISDDEIDKMFKMFKADVDTTCESFGLQFKEEDAYKLLFDLLGISNNKISQFIQEYQTLFLQYPPELKDGAYELLNHCKKNDYNIIIASNTVLIPGIIMRQALLNSIVYAGFSVMHYVKHAIFSDEVNVSKPNPKFFMHVQTAACSLKRNIIHIGDNITSDIEGARNYGFKTIIVNNDLLTVTNKIESLFNNTHEEGLIKLNIFN